MSRSRGTTTVEAERLRGLLHSLSEAGYVVLLWLCEGKRNGEIASILHRSCRTVESHVAAVLEKLGVETRGAAVRIPIDWHIATGTPLPWPDDPASHDRNPPRGTW
jgi:DNA-binding CsgD family transcriptional regulator